MEGESAGDSWVVYELSSRAEIRCLKGGGERIAEDCWASHGESIERGVDLRVSRAASLSSIRAS